MVLETRPVGPSGLRVPTIGFGTSGLGNMPDTYGYAVDETRAYETVRRLLADPAEAFIDTSNNYGMGESERRIGHVLRELGGLPDGAILSTKLDRDMQTRRLDAARARRSLEESLERLSLDRVPILHLHDPEHCASIDDIVGDAGALSELFRLRDEGLAGAVGLAAGNVDVMMPLLADWDFDCLITHNRYTLVNRNAEPMIALAASKGMAVFNAAPYAGGALAKGPDQYPRYVYQEASDAMLEPLRKVAAVCERHGVPIGAAALQFSMRDPRITSTICGVSKPERVEETLAWANWPIDDALWDELASLPFERNDPEATRDYKPG